MQQIIITNFKATSLRMQQVTPSAYHPVDECLRLPVISEESVESLHYLRLLTSGDEAQAKEKISTPKGAETNPAPHIIGNKICGTTSAICSPSESPPPNFTSNAVNRMDQGWRRLQLDQQVRNTRYRRYCGYFLDNGVISQEK